MDDPVSLGVRDALTERLGRAPRLRRCTRVYLVLMALTLLTFLIRLGELDTVWTSLLVLGFALLKGQLIGDFFMGLGGLQGGWRWVIVLWLLVVGALIASAFLLADRGIA